MRLFWGTKLHFTVLTVVCSTLFLSCFIFLPWCIPSVSLDAVLLAFLLHFSQCLPSLMSLFFPYSLYTPVESLKLFKIYSVVTFYFFSEQLQWIQGKSVFCIRYMIKHFTYCKWKTSGTEILLLWWIRSWEWPLDL